MEDVPVRHIRLEEWLSGHLVDATVFAPFVISRLQSAAPPSSAELVVRVVDSDLQARSQERILIEWEPERSSELPLPMQERVITEWAALGIASVLVSALFGKRLVSVALEGDRFDYRIGDSAQEYGL